MLLAMKPQSYSNNYLHNCRMICQHGENVKKNRPSLNKQSLNTLSPSTAYYDEQIGETFTQSFTSMAYNVTAVPQVDESGYGPAYLLNGLSNTGYWYQVGLSYDWSGIGTGFAMVYEIWDPSGKSIFPTTGGGGVQGFSGPVHAGDIVLLNLYFGTGSYAGDVV